MPTLCLLRLRRAAVQAPLTYNSGMFGTGVAKGRTSNDTRRLARRVLYSFLLTFMAARVVVFLIMARWLPDVFLHVRGTHVHHLNYGIFLLAGVGAYLLFSRPVGRALSVTAVLYGIGLALTFDEFGMWLHLGGSYWQRASFDAVVVIAGLLSLIAYSTGLRRLRRRRWTGTVVLAVAVVVFGVLLVKSLNWAGQRLGPRVEQLEQSGPQ